MGSQHLSPDVKIPLRYRAAILGFGERETSQYTSNLYCSTPPICTAARLPFVPGILLRKYQGLGVPESS